MKVIHTILALVCSTSVSLLPALSSAQTVRGPAAASETSTQRVKANPNMLKQELSSLSEQIQALPRDPHLRFRQGQILYALENKSEALKSYREVVELDPHFYVAYHEIAKCTEDEKLIDQYTAILTKLQKERPKDLMLRIALSEFLEKKKNYREAARVLIDLVYANEVPVKYTAKVNARIHHLLSLSKMSEATKATLEAPATNEEGLDLLPAPPPLPSRGISAHRVRESKEMHGVGHTPLLP